jgi:hypothetical protein
MAKIYDINLLSFVTLFSSYSTPATINVISVQELKIEIGANGVTAQSAPVFFVTLTGTDGHGGTLSVSQGAAGPRVSDFQGQSTRHALLTESARTGLLSAFARVIVATSKRFDSTP